MTEGAKVKRWYVRRGTEVRGPFLVSQIGRLAALGRIRADDELSPDQADWRPLSALPELLPEALRDGGDVAQLQQIRLREDERRAGDRRDGQVVPPAVAERRSGKERREPEGARVVRHRVLKSALMDELSKRRETYRTWGLFMAAVLVAVVVVALWAVPSRPLDRPRCNAPAAANVNWNNCRFEVFDLPGAELAGVKLRNARLRDANLFGARLAGGDLAYTELPRARLGHADLRGAVFMGANLNGADLAYADLTGADLRYADLRGAILGGAELQGARLDHARWVDARVCAPGSVGECAGF